MIINRCGKKISPWILKSCRAISKQWNTQKDKLEELHMQFEMKSDSDVKLKPYVKDLEDKLEAVETCGKSFKKWLLKVEWATSKEKVT